MWISGGEVRGQASLALRGSTDPVPFRPNKNKSENSMSTQTENCPDKGTLVDYLLGKLRASVPSSYPIGIQTNGLLISDSVLDICVRHNVTVAVSLDGPAEINDIIAWITEHAAPSNV